MNRSSLRYLLQVVVCLLTFGSLAACSRMQPAAPPGEDASTVQIRRHLAQTLQHYSFAGQHDSVILVARPAYREAAQRHDTLLMVYTGLNMAQSFLFMGNMDSVRRYVDLIEPLKRFPVSASLHIMRSNVLGSYFLRSSLDYSKALNNYIEGLAWADGKSNANNRIALLSNIVNIFYVQNSDKGFDYAREAYELAISQPDISLYSKCAACIVMAQMYYVEHDYDSAIRYLNRADRYAEEVGAHSQMSFIYAMFAWISQSRGETAEASRFYAQAIEFIRYTDPGTASQIYLTYGDYLLARGERTAAAGMYRKGLEVSETSGNMEYRKSLLGQMADLSYETGDYLAAAKYSRMYKTYSDTTSNLREREFRELIEQREESEFQRMMLARELKERKNRQRTMLLLSVSIGVTGFSFLLGLLYYRQRKMYGKLVKKHQEYVSLLDLKSHGGGGTVGEEHNDTDRELFGRIDHLMRDDKIYRMKNLTLEVLADMTASNRTYCSRAINTFAGMSFNRYLDTFRIAEATKLIADNGNAILFKQLADDLGYNSVSVFSKAFQRETGCSPSIYRKEVRGYKSDKKSENL